MGLRPAYLTAQLADVKIFAVGVVLTMVATVIGAVLTAANLIIGATRFIWDSFASFGGKRDNDYSIVVRTPAPTVEGFRLRRVLARAQAPV